VRTAKAEPVQSMWGRRSPPDRFSNDGPATGLGLGRLSRCSKRVWDNARHQDAQIKPPRPIGRSGGLQNCGKYVPRKKLAALRCCFRMREEHWAAECRLEEEAVAAGFHGPDRHFFRPFRDEASHQISSAARE